ncbi:MAG TPA: hypothetical protein VGH81_00395 [Rudaea sp.]
MALLVAIGQGSGGDGEQRWIGGASNAVDRNPTGLSALGGRIFSGAPVHCAAIGVQ